LCVCVVLLFLAIVAGFGRVLQLTLRRGAESDVVSFRLTRWNLFFRCILFLIVAICGIQLWCDLCGWRYCSFSWLARGLVRSGFLCARRGERVQSCVACSSIRPYSYLIERYSTDQDIPAEMASCSNP